MKKVDDMIFNLPMKMLWPKETEESMTNSGQPTVCWTYCVLDLLCAGPTVCWTCAKYFPYNPSFDPHHLLLLGSS
jgi:hypothetical protein